MGDEPALINEVAANFESWDAYKKKIEFHVGPIGFSLATIDHGAWNIGLVRGSAGVGKTASKRQAAQISGALPLCGNLIIIKGTICAN